MASPGRTSPGAAQIGFWMATALVVGNAIGSGIFLLPPALAPFGADNLPGWLLTAGGANRPGPRVRGAQPPGAGAGGPYAYTRAAFGDLAGLHRGLGLLDLDLGRQRGDRNERGRLRRRVPPLDGRHAAQHRAVDARVRLGADAGELRRHPRGGLGAGRHHPDQAPPAGRRDRPARVERPVARRHGLPPRPHFTLDGTAAVATLALWAMLGIESATIPADKVTGGATTVQRATIAGTVVTVILSAAGCAAVLLLVPGPQARGLDRAVRDADRRRLGAGRRRGRFPVRGDERPRGAERLDSPPGRTAARDGGRRPVLPGVRQDDRAGHTRDGPPRHQRPRDHPGPAQRAPHARRRLHLLRAARHDRVARRVPGEFACAGAPAGRATGPAAGAPAWRSGFWAAPARSTRSARLRAQERKRCCGARCCCWRACRCTRGLNPAPRDRGRDGLFRPATPVASLQQQSECDRHPDEQRQQHPRDRVSEVERVANTEPLLHEERRVLGVDVERAPTSTPSRASGRPPGPLLQGPSGRSIRPVRGGRAARRGRSWQPVRRRRARSSCAPAAPAGTTRNSAT